MKDFDLEEPTSFLDHVYLGCTQRECQTSKDTVDNNRSMFESRISAGAVEKLPSTGKLDATISSWSYDMEGHAQKCVERYCELANKTSQQLHKVATQCLDHTNSKKKWDELENYLLFAHRLFWNACIWPVLVDLTFYGSWTNLLVQSQNGLKRVRNAWLVWSLTFITHVHYNNSVMWEIQYNNADWDCFRILILPEI